jgi:hypothetical protein
VVTLHKPGSMSGAGESRHVARQRVDGF